MKLAVPTETRLGESRVASSSRRGRSLSQSGVDVVVQSGAGSKAHFPDTAYGERGASVAGAAPTSFWPGPM